MCSLLYAGNTAVNKKEQNSWSHFRVYSLLGRRGDRQSNYLVTYIVCTVMISITAKNKAGKDNRQGQEWW